MGDSWVCILRVVYNYKLEFLFQAGVNTPIFLLDVRGSVHA